MRGRDKNSGKVMLLNADRTIIANDGQPKVAGCTLSGGLLESLDRFPERKLEVLSWLIDEYAGQGGSGENLSLMSAIRDLVTAMDRDGLASVKNRLEWSLLTQSGGEPAFRCPRCVE